MSQSQIANLNVMLGINTAQFAAGLASAQGSLGAFGESLKKFAAMAGVTLSFAAVTASIKSTVDHMDELGKAAQKIGIPVEDLSKLEYAAKLSDVSLEDLTGTLAKFSKNIAEVGAGGQNDAGKALQALGISATDAQGQLRPTVDIMSDIADEFASMQDGAGKTAIAIALFGKSGAEMIPLLNGGSEAIKEAADQARVFGAVVSQEAAAAAEHFNDNLTKLQEAASGIQTQIATALLPQLNNLTDILVTLAERFNLSEQAANGFEELLKDSAIFAATTYKEFYALSQIASVLAENLNNPTSFDEAMKRWQLAFDNIEKQAEETAVTIAKIQNSVLGDPTGSKASIDKNFPGAAPPAKAPAPYLPPSTSSKKAAKPGTLDDIYGEGFTKATEEAQKSLEDLFNEMQAGDPTVKAPNDGFKDMADTLVSDLSNSIAGLIAGTTSLQDAFQTMAQSVIQQLEEIAAAMIKSEIFKILGMVGTSIGGAQGFMGFGGLYADGGTLGSGKWGIAGEAGPEIIHGPATITPMDKIGGGSGGASIQINNYVSNASVQTRQQPDGRITVDFVEKELAERVARGGSPLSAGLEKGYGLRRSGR